DQKLDQLTAHAIVGMSAMLKQVKPDVIVLQGDTTTAFVTALAGFYQRIPLAHVEAGLRTQDRFAPFPEEINRRLITHLADYHFAPTNWARENLLREGVARERIFVTGNTVVDVFLEAQRLVRRRPPVIPSLNGLKWANRKLLLVTAHRRENFGQGLKNICFALRELASCREDIEIVYPVHPNPNVLEPVHRSIGALRRIHLIGPVEYLQFVWLMTQAYLVLTDSGGIQEEMPSLGRPVLVMREKTERPEGIEAGVCQLVGTDPDIIQRAVLRLLDDKQAYRQFAQRQNPFGDGKAAPRIVKHLARVLQ
ncbi:MAG: UDP-N-acetylglucosamine 2-epimerase (non-hydrolyzing), partial [Candidatus Acidiferrales bacterium]